MFTNGLRCCIKNCKTKNSTNISFFGYPRDESIRKIWIQNCGLDDATNSQDNLKANLKVCRLHFEDRMFTNVLKKNRLVLNAIPTLNLNNGKYSKYYTLYTYSLNITFKLKYF